MQGILKGKTNFKKIKKTEQTSESSMADIYIRNYETRNLKQLQLIC